MSTITGLPRSFASRPATMDDLKAVVALRNLCTIEQVGAPLIEEAELQTEWQAAPFDLARDSRLVLTPRSEVVACAALWGRAPYVRLFAEGWVHPVYRGRTIGTALARWLEERGRMSVERAPAGTRVVLEQTILNADARARSLLQLQGYCLARHFLNMGITMDEPPPAPVLPDGLVIRPFAREREARALVRSIREALDDHWGYVETPFEEDYQLWLNWMDNDPAFDPSLWFLALDGDQIAGFSLCYGFTAEDAGMGEVANLGVRLPWRRQGLGLALLHHSFGELYRRGRRKVTLGVDAHSLTGAVRLYERAGMKVRRRYDCYQKELRPGDDLATQSLKA